MYEMKDEYLTGIEQIDLEHKRLFEIAQETYQLKNNEFIPDKYDQIKALFEQLKEYTKMHFQHEEEYMQAINYKKLFTQKIQHEAFIKWLEDQELEGVDGEFENQDAVIETILNYLADWLIHHILETDKQIPKPEN